MRTRIKFCGITRLDDARSRRRARRRCDRIRVHARAASASSASAQAREHPRRAAAVRDRGRAVHGRRARLDRGSASRACSPICCSSTAPKRDGFASSFARPYIKAVPMGSVDDRGALHRRLSASAAGFLLDSHARGAPRRHRRDVRLDARAAGTAAPFVLAGGLDARQRGAGDRRRATLRRGCLQRHRIRARHQGCREDARIRRRGARGRCRARRLSVQSQRAWT